MQKVSTMYLIEDSMNFNYRGMHSTLNHKWEKKARELQKRRWQTLKKLTKDGKI